MRKFTDKEILEKLKTLKNFEKRNNELPIIVGIQSLEDKFDEFDDKFYLYDKNHNFILVTSGTTNAGSTGLKNFMKWNPKGTGVWKTNEFYPKCYKIGLHNGKMKALRLSTAIKHYRDNDKDNKAEEQGIIYESNTNANFHTVTYEDIKKSKKIEKRIGSWGVMCNVCNIVQDYSKIITFVEDNGGICDYAILKEW